MYTVAPRVPTQSRNCALCTERGDRPADVAYNLRKRDTANGFRRLSSFSRGFRSSGKGRREREKGEERGLGRPPIRRRERTGWGEGDGKEKAFQR